ncbi:oligoribonuclease-like isoform X1 [Mangifera indica]|uniref:oligoribonuclease-like isoform X1 n=1 Tax=Mangifera indica TaxID=29780 RepID=UPI001CFA1F53|nr:oligoribonuclease-like isoform X1 [Mangifera indica]
METISNRFSELELDAEDDQLQSSSASSSSRTSGQAKNKAKVSSDAKPVKIEKRNEENSENCLDYKLPLVWIDLEMTGLNIEVDRILEIACIITDGHLKKLVEGPDLVIHQSKECLDSMGEWCQNQHEASGLTKKVLLSTLSEREAEKQVIEFVKRNVGTYTPLLAGNSVYVDFQFLKKARKLHQKRIDIELWMILEKASWNSNTIRKAYLDQSQISNTKKLAHVIRSMGGSRDLTIFVTGHVFYNYNVIS